MSAVLKSNQILPNYPAFEYEGKKYAYTTRNGKGQLVEKNTKSKLYVNDMIKKDRRIYDSSYSFVGGMKEEEKAKIQEALDKYLVEKNEAIAAEKERQRRLKVPLKETEAMADVTKGRQPVASGSSVGTQSTQTGSGGGNEMQTKMITGTPPREATILGSQRKRKTLLGEE